MGFFDRDRVRVFVLVAVFDLDALLADTDAFLERVAVADGRRVRVAEGKAIVDADGVAATVAADVLVAVRVDVMLFDGVFVPELEGDAEAVILADEEEVADTELVAELVSDGEDDRVWAGVADTEAVTVLAAVLDGVTVAAAVSDGLADEDTEALLEEDRVGDDEKL